MKINFFLQKNDATSHSSRLTTKSYQWVKIHSVHLYLPAWARTTAKENCLKARNRNHSKEIDFGVEIHLRSQTAPGCVVRSVTTCDGRCFTKRINQFSCPNNGTRSNVPKDATVTKEKSNWKKNRNNFLEVSWSLSIKATDMGLLAAVSANSRIPVARARNNQDISPDYFDFLDPEGACAQGFPPRNRRSGKSRTELTQTDDVGQAPARMDHMDRLARPPSRSSSECKNLLFPLSSSDCSVLATFWVERSPGLFILSSFYRRPGRKPKPKKNSVVFISKSMRLIDFGSK